MHKNHAYNNRKNQTDINQIIVDFPVILLSIGTNKKGRYKIYIRFRKKKDLNKKRLEIKTSSVDMCNET